VCDLEISRIGAPYIYDISSLRVNIQEFYMVLALRRVFCMDLRADCDFCFIHH